MAAFGNLNNITIGIGMLAQPFIKGMKFVAKITKNAMKGIATSLKKTGAAFRKTSKESNSKDSIFSPGWFKKRARWFIQLRLFWSIWQGLVKAIRGAFEFEKEMASVRAITQATNAQFELLRQKALEVGVTTIFSAAEAAKGMVVMSQAGLDVTEILTSIINVANLATATLFDFEKTASLVVTIMRAWNLEASDTQRITDTLATSINKTKLTMHSLAAGFNFVSGIAPQMNLSLEETTALLGTLANRGLSASTAATSLRAVMAALLSPTDKFKRVLKDIGLTVRDVDPRFHDMVSILQTLQDAGFGVAESFRAFRRRAAAGAAILISSAHEVGQLSEGMNEVGRAAAMAEIQLDTVEGQAKQFNDTMIALADSIFKDLEPAITLAIQLFKTLMVDIMSLLKPLAKAVGWFAKLAKITKTFVERGASGVDTEITVRELIELNAQLKTTEKALLDVDNNWSKLGSSMAKIKQQINAALSLDEMGKANDNMKNALKIAMAQHLITKEEKAEVLKIQTIQGQALKLNKLLGEEYQRRLRVATKEERIQKRSQQLLKADITRLTVEEVKKKAAMVKETEKLLIAEQKRVQIYKNLIAKKVDEKNVDEQRVKLRHFEKQRDKALDKYNADLFEMFRILRAGGGEAEKLSKVLGPAWANMIKAILTAPNFSSLQATLKDIRSASSDASGATKEMTDAFLKGKKVQKDLPDLLAKTSKERIKELKDLKLMEQQKIKMAQQEKKRLQTQDETHERENKILEVDKQIHHIKNGIVFLDKEIEKLAVEESQVKLQALDLQYKINAADLTAIENAKTKKDLAITIAKIQRQLKADLSLQKHLNELEEVRGNKEIDRLKNEQKLIDLKKTSAELTLVYQQSLAVVDQDSAKIAASHLIIQEATNATAINIENQRQNQDAIARNLAESRRNELDVQSIKESFHTKGGIIDTLISSGEGGLQDALLDITTLWSAQREEANALEAELEGLNREYQQAMSEGNIQRAEELKLQMTGLRSQIDGLNDPLKNLANTFKSFARVVIEELQKVIIKMLVVKLIGTVLGMFAGGGSTSMVQGFTIPSADAALFRGATGGIFPGGTFGNFRKFAKGGVTSGAGLAMLGDNASGKELVIPSENISDDKVSGHVRKEGQPINIINILTDQDIAAAMSKAPGQRTIINTIGQDIGKRGPTYRAIRA